MRFGITRREYNPTKIVLNGAAYVRNNAINIIVKYRPDFFFFNIITTKILNSRHINRYS